MRSRRFTHSEAVTLEPHSRPRVVISPWQIRFQGDAHLALAHKQSVRERKIAPTIVRQVLLRLQGQVVHNVSSLIRSISRRVFCVFAFSRENMPEGNLVMVIRLHQPRKTVFDTGIAPQMAKARSQFAEINQPAEGHL